MKLIDNIEEFKKGYDSYIHNNIYNWFCFNNCSLNVLEYYIKNYDEIDWVSISKDQPITEDFVDKYSNDIIWLKLFNNDDVILSDAIIEKHLKKYSEKYEINYHMKLVKVINSMVCKVAFNYKFLKKVNGI